MKKILSTIAILSLLAVRSPALYRGDEYQQRDYNIDSEYYVDVLPLQPSIETRMRFAEADKAYFVSAGSYSRSDLYLLQWLKLREPLAEPTFFTFDFDMSQDFDTSFDEHHFVGAFYPLNEAWSAGVVGEPLARKEFSDIGIAVKREIGSARLDARLLFPNFSFNSRKDDMGGNFVEEPVTFLLHALQPVTTQLTLFASADLDFSSETRYQKPVFDFAYESYKPGVGAVWRFDNKKMVWAEYNFESTDKERKGSADATEDFTTDRTFHSARIEYVLRPEDRKRYSLGAFYAYIDEDNVYPVGRTNDFQLIHTTRMFYGMCSVPMTARMNFNTGLIVDLPEHRELRPYRAKRPEIIHEYMEGKVPVAIEITGRNYSIELGLSVQIDSLLFGGGYGGLQVYF